MDLVSFQKNNITMSFAGRAQVANGAYPPGVQPRQYQQQQCAFPAPPPSRIYCQPAQFTQVDGRQQLLIASAYGQSTADARVSRT